MAEERITQIETPSGDTHTHTTVVSDEPRSGGGGAMWVVVMLMIVIAAVAVFYLSGISGSETAKDNAVAEAAGDIGDAAQKAGDAVQDTANNLNR